MRGIDRDWIVGGKQEKWRREGFRQHGVESRASGGLAQSERAGCHPAGRRRGEEALCCVVSAMHATRSRSFSILKPSTAIPTLSIDLVLSVFLCLENSVTPRREATTLSIHAITLTSSIATTLLLAYLQEVLK